MSGSTEQLVIEGGSLTALWYNTGGNIGSIPKNHLNEMVIAHMN